VGRHERVAARIPGEGGAVRPEHRGRGPHQRGAG
jgi:hypothetical protein